MAREADKELERAEKGEKIPCVWHTKYEKSCTLCQDCNAKPKSTSKFNQSPSKNDVAEQTKHRYFVSNFFLEKVFDNIIKDIERMRDNLEEKMAATIEKCNSLLDIRQIEIPAYDKRIKAVNYRITQVNRLLLNKHFDRKGDVTK